MSLQLHIPEPLRGVDLAPWFRQQGDGALFSRAARSTFFDSVERVAPEAACAMVLPHNFLRLDDAARAYIKQYADMGEKLGMPVILFSLGDYSDSLQFDSRVVVLRLSVYRSTLRPNDVVMPTLTEDIGAERFVLRAKQEVPVVSFCGRAAFTSMRERVASWVRRLKYEALGLVRKEERARIRGIFWRQWMMRVCERSALVKTLFIVRSTFSGALRTIEISPEQARKDFIQNVAEADFVLAPKGDGNYSNRFLEALSMGRIPVVVDTDMVLPFEDTIDYGRVMVRVPMGRVAETPRYIHEFYTTLDEAGWRERQELARTVFVEHLAVDAFFKHFFDTVVTCAASPEQPPQE